MTKFLNSGARAIVLADEHWKWLERILADVYKSAFIHGYKHCLDDSADKHKED